MSGFIPTLVPLLSLIRFPERCTCLRCKGIYFRAFQIWAESFVSTGPPHFSKHGRFWSCFRFLLQRLDGNFAVQEAEETISNVLAFPNRKFLENTIKGVPLKRSDAFVRINPLACDRLILYHRDCPGPSIAVRNHQGATLFGLAGMDADAAGDIERVPPGPTAVSQEIKNRIGTCTHNRNLLIFICVAQKEACSRCFKYFCK